MSPGIHLLLYSSFAVLIFLAGSIQLHLIIAACVTIALIFVPFKKVKSGFVPIFFFLGFTFISNLFYQSGRVIAVMGPVTLTDEGLRIASTRTLRIFDMVYAAKILTFITPLEEMLNSLNKILCPLERIGLPVREFFSAMALTLQCFPVLKQKMYERYSENSKQHRSPNTISDFRSAAVLLASSLIPLFVESMAEPEKFLKTTRQTTEVTEGNTEDTEETKV